jgi:hypothetical protein
MHAERFPRNRPPKEKTINTDGPLVNVSRGYYFYEIARYGYKTIDVPHLDLMAETPTLLVCEMVEQSRPEPALECDRFYEVVKTCRRP